MSERPPSPDTLYPSRPTVRVDGAASAKVSELLLALRVEESEGGLSSLEMTLSNVARFRDNRVNLAFEDETLIRFGTSIEVYSGDQRTPVEIFRGLVSGMEGRFEGVSGPELVVLAEDAFQKARLARRTKVHENATIASVAQDLATQLGLSPVVTGLTSDLGVQFQLNESDLAFLRRLLSLADGDLQVVGRELHISPRKDVRRGSVELALGSQLARARVTADLAHQCTAVTTYGWDAAQGQRVSGRGTGVNLGPGTGRQGATLLQEAFGERVEHLGELCAKTDTEAQALADAAFDARARRFVRVSATATGNPTLRVGTHVSLVGMGARFDNTYYITRACHRFDVENGYETDFEAESAYFGGP